VAAAAWWTARAALSRCGWLLLHADVRALAAVASLGPVALYAALAGLEVPTLRSGSARRSAADGTRATVAQPARAVQMSFCATLCRTFDNCVDRRRKRTVPNPAGHRHAAALRRRLARRQERNPGPGAEEDPWTCPRLGGSSWGNSPPSGSDTREWLRGDHDRRRSRIGPAFFAHHRVFAHSAHGLLDLVIEEEGVIALSVSMRGKPAASAFCHCRDVSLWALGAAPSRATDPALSGRGQIARGLTFDLKKDDPGEGKLPARPEWSVFDRV